MVDGIGIWQVVIVAVIILLLFGSNRIPEMMKGLGSGLKEFKKGLREGLTDEEPAAKKSEQPSTAAKD